jgi:hypothetical protein
MNVNVIVVPLKIIAKKINDDTTCIASFFVSAFPGYKRSPVVLLPFSFENSMSYYIYKPDG